MLQKWNKLLICFLLSNYMNYVKSIKLKLKLLLNKSLISNIV